MNKKEFESLKAGDIVKLSKSILATYAENAFSFHTIPGQGVMLEAANSFVLYVAIGYGVPYQAKVIRRHDKDTVLLRISLLNSKGKPTKLRDIEYVEKDSLSNIIKRKGRS